LFDVRYARIATEFRIAGETMGDRVSGFLGKSSIRVR
jgi:hypothetical protein